jgi:hypothetical protein
VYPQIELYRQQKLVEELLFPVLIWGIEELGYDLVLRQGEVDPSWIRQDCDQIRNLLLNANVRVFGKLIRVIDQRSVQMMVEFSRIL